MTRQKALHEFFNSFGLPAYPVTAVPDDTVLPYMTYEVSLGNWGDSISIACGLWYHTESEAVPNIKVNEINEAIGLGGVIVNCDEGAMWVKRGTPFSNSVNTQDNSLKHRSLNVTIEYM